MNMLDAWHDGPGRLQLSGRFNCPDLFPDQLGACGVTLQ